MAIVWQHDNATGTDSVGIKIANAELTAVATEKTLSELQRVRLLRFPA